MLGPLVVTLVFFFFQAEDGIRDHCVTGVQTCALPILQGVVTPSQPAGLPGPPTKWSPSSAVNTNRSEEHTSELQSHSDLVCRLLLEKKKTFQANTTRSRLIANRNLP